MDKITQEELNRMRKAAEYALQGDRESSRMMALDLLNLLDEYDRIRTVHREEQARSADRLRKALENE